MKLIDSKSSRIINAIASALYAFSDCEYVTVEVWDSSTCKYVVDETFSNPKDAAIYIDALVDLFPTDAKLSLWTVDYTLARFTFIVNADWARGRI